MMRSDLSHLPLPKRRELERVVARILESFSQHFARATMPWKREAAIRQIVLFGSYARGDWVDELMTGRGYRSDFDLLIVVNDAKVVDCDDVWTHVEEDLLADQKAHPMRPDVNFIVHSECDVQKMLDKQRYFFMDIVRDGLTLYRADGARDLTLPKEMLPDAVRRAEAKVHFEEWWPSADEFFQSAYIDIERGWLKKAAFDFHQAVERLYACFLLVKTNYTPRTHNIKTLRSLAESLEPRLIPVWPRATQAQRKPFNKLKDAYVKARYSPQYKITREELEWLGERVKELQSLVETIRPT